MDHDKISIEDLKHFLQERDLLPSRKILKQNIDQYFALIEMKVFITLQSS